MEQLLTRLALQYLHGQHQEPSASELQTFNNFIITEYHKLPLPVRFVDADVSPEVMLHNFKWNKQLVISTLGSDHPNITHNVNWMFRAVHDYHHASQGFGFDFTGEVQSAVHCMNLAPESIRWMLWSEIALQAAATIHCGNFQHQKLVR